MGFVFEPNLGCSVSRPIGEFEPVRPRMGRRIVLMVGLVAFLPFFLNGLELLNPPGRMGRHLDELGWLIAWLAILIGIYKGRRGGWV